MEPEYIERKALDKALTAAAANGKDKDHRTWAKAICVLHDMPAADVAQVRHGRWEFLGPNMLNRGCMCGTCSACKVRSEYIVNTGLCPNCGAKMDGGTEDAG